MIVEYQGYKISINEKLLDAQDAWENLGELLKIRVAIGGLMLEAKTYYENNTLTKELGHVIVNSLERLEYKLQDAWKFSRDKDFHSYQDRLAGCTCPSMDNEELYGTDMRYVSVNCPYHAS